MALFNIEFKRTEYYYFTERIEADSEEEAKEIANKLIHSIDYEDRLIQSGSYDSGETEFSEAHADDIYWHHPTLTKEEIADYIGEE